jgi:PAS domain S-box-containing protein
MEGFLAESHQPRVETQAKNEPSLFFEFASDLLVVTGVDGVINQASFSFLKILGWSPEEIEGKFWLEFIHPADRQTSEIKRVSFEEKILEKNYTNRFLCKNGTFKVIAWKQTALIKEKIVLIIGRDITDTMNIEEALKEKEEKCRHLLQHAPVGIYEIDYAADKFLCVNDAMSRLQVTQVKNCLLRNQQIF